MSLGVVTKYLFDLIAKQVDDKRLVVWYDPEQAYGALASEISLPNGKEIGSVFLTEWRRIR